ncbi:hypothetical protein X907_1512 [Glycocaulis alkaliphilus]|uniref:Uncharacterized protein n=1 Tax=Glycocaulis alkaliphilus TaxID=1434191 RepID=A0A3T0E9C5_9PROT|nr:DUF2271 domain-containing protein [Glycocaulis alkaliphilus]AZU04045.1 hypothetical protein X907_1512 [Glycocaulis alkaliphilus]GGB75373.1 hypothetical protein GCM10007417_13970 [Glycocaulis alkaliphilus]
MRLLLPAALTGALTGPALAGELRVEVEIPRLNVAEYHRPYVAVWIEQPDQTAVATLSVWYDVALRNGEGTTWLKDMRQWWRRAGRAMEMPADGISGATRPPGRHATAYEASHPALSALVPGEYRLVVEAAREVGGRELVRIPFQWPPEAGQTLETTGSHELGAVVIHLNP